MENLDNEYDTIIIGSGIGGMTAGVFLAKGGNEKVLILEQHPTELGGCTHEFERKGTEFDTGIHYIGGDMYDSNSTMRRVFDYVTGGKINWLKMEDAFDSTIVNGELFPIRSGIENQKGSLKLKFPDQPIHEWFDDVQKTAERYTRFILAQIGPAYLPPFIVEQVLTDHTFGEETVTSALDRLKITNQTLRKILTYNYGDYGPAPDYSSYVQHCMTVVHYSNGSSYPVGGPHLIAENVKHIIESHGGKMLTNSRVSSIYVEKNHAKGVYLERSPHRLLKAKKVISACGAFNTYVNLLGNEGHI